MRVKHLLWLAFLVPLLSFGQAYTGGGNAYVPGISSGNGNYGPSGYCFIGNGLTMLPTWQVCSAGGGVSSVTGSNGVTVSPTTGAVGVSLSPIAGGFNYLCNPTGSTASPIGCPPVASSTVGQAAEFSTANTITGASTVLYVDQFPGSDNSTQVENCLNALQAVSPDAGKCIDNVVGPVTWSFNPLSAATLPYAGTLELCGPSTITISAPIVNAQGWNIEGCGDSQGFAGNAAQFIANASAYPATYYTGTVTVGTAGQNDIITGSGTAWTANMVGCAIMAGIANGTVTLTSGMNTATVNTTAFGTLAVGQKFIAPGLPLNTTITAISGATLTLSANATANETTVLFNAVSTANTYGIIHSVDTGAQTMTLGFGTNNGGGAAAASPYAIECAMLVAGDGDNANGYVFTGDMSGFTINCNNIAGCINYQNFYSEEGTTASNLQLAGTSNIAWDVETGLADQAGPYTNLSMGGGSSCTEWTIAATLRIANTHMKPFQNSTVGACGSPLGLVAVDLQGSIHVSGIHVESATHGISVGDNTPCPVFCPNGPSSAGGEIIENIGAAGTGNTVVYLPFGAASATVHSITYQGGSSWVNTLADTLNGCTDSSSVLGTYLTGDSGEINLLSSTTNCPGEPFFGTVTLQQPHNSVTGGAWDSSPPINFDAFYESSTGVTSAENGSCEVYENGGLNGYSAISCQRTTGTNPNYYGFEHDGGIFSHQVYSAAGTSLPNCTAAGSSPLGNGGAIFLVIDATNPTGPYVSGGTIRANVECIYTGSAYVWVMAEGTGNAALGTFATQNYATPPAIGGTTPAAGSFSILTDTAITGSSQCVQVNTSGVLSGAGVTCGAAAGSPANVQVFSYTGSTQTWTKPSGTPQVTKVICIGAGGGGGSGYSELIVGTAESGGAGGGSGAYLETTFATANLGSTETVTIGAGGAGGVAVGTGNPGNHGVVGGNSSFGTTPWVTCYGGGYGAGGASGTTAAGGQSGAAAGAGGTGLTLSTNYGGGVGGSGGTAPTLGLFGAGGGTSNDGATAGSVNGAGGIVAGGGGGGGVTISAQAAGGTGGPISQTAPPAGGTAGGGTGTSGTTTTAGYFGGTGGAGGGSNNTGVGGTGGTGGIGAGGGGGGVGVTANSGAGGPGGNGYIVVITTY